MSAAFALLCTLAFEGDMAVQVRIQVIGTRAVAILHPSNLWIEFLNWILWIEKPGIFLLCNMCSAVIYGRKHCLYSWVGVSRHMYQIQKSHILLIPHQENCIESQRAMFGTNYRLNVLCHIRLCCTRHVLAMPFCLCVCACMCVREKQNWTYSCFWSAFSVTHQNGCCFLFHILFNFSIAR